MRTIRIILGGCLDLVLFGLLVPLGAVKTGRMLDAGLFTSLHLDLPIFDFFGIVLIIVGAGWLLWAFTLLVKAGGGYMTELFCITVSPVTVRLVDQGPYGVHRHPVGIGYLALLCGIGLVIGSPGTILVGGGALPVLFFIYLRLFEEPCLKKRLGDDYQRYIETVPIFFPRRRYSVPVAFRNLHADRIRFTISVAGVAFAVLLICFQLSILKGTSAQITTYIDHVGADIWAMQKGVDDFIATSVVPADSVQNIEKMVGVSRATGIYAIYTLLHINNVKSRVYVVGYDPVSGDGGPWRLGRTLPHIRDIHDIGEKEIFLDLDLAQRHGLDLGDTVSLFGHAFLVAGLTLETTSIGSQYAFLSREAVGRILPGGEFAFTHILIWTGNKVPDAQVIGHLEEATPLTALTRAELAENMRGFLGMFMLPLLMAGAIVGFLVGSVTIGITLYTSVLERFKEYGTMKALGASGAYLYGLLLRQAFISLSIGAVLGLLLAAAANHFINHWVPGMTARLDGVIVLQTLLAGLVMALLSTGLPMWRLLRIDPLEAFRE